LIADDSAIRKCRPAALFDIPSATNATHVHANQANSPATSLTSEPGGTPESFVKPEKGIPKIDSDLRGNALECRPPEERLTNEKPDLSAGLSLMI
jgi:hypothetical protein